jgi:hypothetical protein
MTGSVEGASAVAPNAATAAVSPPAVAGGVTSVWGVASAADVPAQASTAVGRDGGAVDDAAGLPAVVEEAGWGPDLPAGGSQEDVEVVAGRVVLANIIKIRTQEINKSRRHKKLTTHVELRTPHPAWKTRDSLLPEDDASGDWQGLSADGISGGGGGACCCC